MDRVWWWGGGLRGAAEVGATWRPPPPEHPHPKQVKHVEEASGKKKQPRQRWRRKIKKKPLCATLL